MSARLDFLLPLAAAPARAAIAELRKGAVVLVDHDAAEATLSRVIAAVTRGAEVRAATECCLLLERRASREPEPSNLASVLRDLAEEIRIAYEVPRVGTVEGGREP